ncbi:HAMP domain-containing histidine kinase [Litoreibacter sp.]|nr:HAMP domain-containing histidine kinase [Litoreibacter sp.]
MSYTTADLDFLENIDPNNATSDQIVQIYAQNLVQANSITSIALEIEAVIDRAIHLKEITDPATVSDAENALQFKMRGIAVLLGQIKPTEAREQLAAEVFRIRNLIISENGVFSEATKFQTNARSLEAQLLGQIAPIQSISSLSDELTQAAREKIDDAKRDLEKTTRDLGIVLVLATSLSLVAIVLTVIVIVERQISQRVAQLTKAVLAIAAGEQEYTVTVSGTDELGRMADALEVFKENADELQRSNLELEKFAYVAAHDLRSPLRAIKDLTEWTLEDTDNVFSEEGVENLGLVRQRIDRLSKMLTDLLEYSRAGNNQDGLIDVSLPEMIAETAEMLNPDDAFEITFIGQCQHVTTYATPLRQVLLNLISNAMKHHDRQTGSITVDTRTENGRLYCTVADDGPGIDPKYHDKIFELFRTLRSRDEVEGSGLGLAIIRKLVEQHGGKISAHSDPDIERGSKFTFDLPDQLGDVSRQKRAA